jgi:hypothetical protein
MARGKRATRADAWGSPEDAQLRRLIRIKGRAQLKKLIDEAYLPEEFDEACLPFLEEMEKYWKHQRSPEARRKARPSKLYRLWTREEIMRADVDKAFPHLSNESKDAVMRRLKRKLRMYKPPN